MKRYLTIGIILSSTLIGSIVIADTNPYIDKGTHFELPLVSDFPQGERVEIAKDKAQMTLKGWNDEYAIKITPQLPAGQSNAHRPLLSNRMEFKRGNITAFIEPISPSEFDIYFRLHTKPTTNVFT